MYSSRQDTDRTTEAAQREQQRRAACYPALVAALEAVEAANAYGLDVPMGFPNDRAWLVNAGVIRQCNDALALAREETQ